MQPSGLYAEIVHVVNSPKTGEIQDPVDTRKG